MLRVRQGLNKACIFPRADCDICFFPVHCLALPWNVFKTLQLFLFVEQCLVG